MHKSPVQATAVCEEGNHVPAGSPRVIASEGAAAEAMDIDADGNAVGHS